MTIHEFRGASIIAIFDFLLIIKLNEGSVGKRCPAIKDALGADDGFAIVGLLAKPRITESRNVGYLAAFPG